LLCCKVHAARANRHHARPCRPPRPTLAHWNCSHIIIPRPRPLLLYTFLSPAHVLLYCLIRVLWLALYYVYKSPLRGYYHLPDIFAGTTSLASHKVDSYSVALAFYFMLSNRLVCPLPDHPFQPVYVFRGRHLYNSRSTFNAHAT
jgi:hypothetical protein